jgi:glycosyltransferase involved in cell wall biosynthesis
MLKVSVAIPVYNAESHLEVGLDSLMHQTMNPAEFEVICVNDCSTDSSKEIIEHYQKKMPNLVLIDRETGSGAPCVPRNNAIDAARGEYILFMDNDDFLGEEALERLYNKAKENQADLAFGKYIGVNGRRVPASMFQNGNRLKASVLGDNLLYAIAPHKMFRVPFLNKYGFRFDPKVIAGNEDQLFVMQSYIAASVITVLADYPYYFVVKRGNENLSLKHFSAKKWLYALFRIMEFLEDFIKDETYRRNIKRAYFTRILQIERVRKQIISPDFTPEQRAEWLDETKRLIDTHFDNDLIRSMEPDLRSFLFAVKENDTQKLAKFHV